ncbi:MAG: glycoside hydrolase family 172 protein [Planctomycetota bacterium]
MRVVLLYFLAAASASALDAITTESLLAEMTDLERLARPATYTCRQFSSYDRLCTKGDPFANADRGNYLRKDGDAYVLAEATGPGAIVRIWSANPEGTLRIRLDDREVLKADFKSLLSGGVSPFLEPLSGMRALGGNLYFPFPYKKSMQVTCSVGNQYYHVGARAWPEGTKVVAYSPYRMPDAAIERARADLKEGAPAPKDCVRRALGQEFGGPGTISEISLKASGSRLREAALKITIDGEVCAWAPLPDFFAVGPAPVFLSTFAMSAAQDGTLVCRFPMPFEKSALVEVELPADGARVEGSLLVKPGTCGPFRFHAWWNGTLKLKTRPMSDWPVLRGEGRGRLVGTALVVRNPVKQWWGEGDEKISIDGEAFPSTFGTGTEDYFGYAWCDTGKFSAPYHAQSRCDGPGNRGWTSVNRFHILDDIPFEKSIRFDMEVWHWDDCVMGYATTAYWYAEPGFRHDAKVAPVEARLAPPMEPAFAVTGAIEGEGMKVEKCTAGEAVKQDMSAYGEGWSGEAQLWWKGGRAGDALTLAFESAMEGKRILAIAMTQAPDYGKVRVSINGVVVLEEVDLHAGTVKRLPEECVTAELKKGKNEIRIQITGTNPDAEPANHLVGLDYVRVVE